MKLLLLANSTQPDREPLAHALAEIVALGVSELLFVPYALADHDKYTSSITGALEQIGIRVRGLHSVANPAVSITNAEGIMVGGGNTFRLLKRLQDLNLVTRLTNAVRDGVPYVGSSAGTNLACPTIRTTNDMPIVEPLDFTALGLVPFQVNPHYIDPIVSAKYMGESRSKRLEEFLEENDVPVVAMREGSWLVVEDQRIGVGGQGGVKLFSRWHTPKEFGTGADLSFLMRTNGRFDAITRAQG